MRRTLSLTAAVAVVALLASCSGGSDDASSTPSGSASSSASGSTSSASPSDSASLSDSGTAGTPAITGGFGADDDVAEQCVSGVALVTDVGDLEDDRDDATEAQIEAAEGAWCITTEAPITAREALDLAGVTTEGTTEYGDAVVCRVNGVPGADLPIVNPDNGESYTETCAGMPAAFAYWSVWLKPAGGEWTYAAEGVDTQQVAPGERLDLQFTLNGEPVNPDGGSAG